ncbi:hypothetical protein [Sphingobacterium deserti]|uniref:Uncharacterized protein n=1 Tax=Sphingobacterium deserti TaxID=1229276 RepID=A0A0B8T588_9SPHI|nr:hypothetical protein [Sphingobacterium deserti]KGE15618.1 hypothetical protein DI53_0722 [Sphingobacterium deserti]
MNKALRYTLSKRSKNTLFLFLFLLNFFPFCHAQNGTITGNGTVIYQEDGSVTVKGSKTFTSYIPRSVGLADYMVRLNTASLFRLDSDLKGGIKSRLDGPASEVTISVYAFVMHEPNFTGRLLYRVKAKTSSSTEFVGEPEMVPNPVGSGNIESDQIKVFMQAASAATEYTCPGASKTMFSATLNYMNGGIHPTINTPLNDCLKGNNFDVDHPVIVEVEVSNATVLPHGLKFPGMTEEYDLANYFDGANALDVAVYVNGEFKKLYVAGDKNQKPIDLVLGDSVTYKLTYKGKKAPKITGMPGVWIARFAGDLMYCCSPSVQPNEFNPWIGYDSRVHTLQMRNKKGNPTFKDKVPDWEKSSSEENTWTWSWAAERQMDANKEKYEASHTWIKYKTLSDGTFQRNNQKEGLNLQFLNYWQNGENSDFKEYKGSAQYMMGFDDDELLYLNSQYHDAIHHPPLAGGGIAKLETIPSREMPEGKDQLYNVRNGYPTQGFPLNTIISAYRKNREWLFNGNTNYFEKYDGYEIQDIGTDELHPDGTGEGNNVAPGYVSIRAGNQVVEIRMNVKSPLHTDKGFYGSLKGNRWPTYYEKDIPYKLSGLEGLSLDELDKFSMEYTGSDALGNLKTQTKRLKDLTDQQKTDISNYGDWTAVFDNNSPAYSAITVYYQRKLGAQRVIVAGKELKPIFLLFAGEKGLEGKGLGAKIWLNDFRNEETDEYILPRQFGGKTKYTKLFVRNYTFPLDTTTTFEAWDGDPHLFYDAGTEWFLSSRTLAKRIPDSYLDGTDPQAEKPYLKYYVNGVEQTKGRSGKNFTYTWRTPGTHLLTVEYRVDGNLTRYDHKITVVNYPKTNLGQQRGRIVVKDLTTQEAKWLGVARPDVYKVLEVVDVYSSYLYKHGPRQNTPYVNRWAEFNDYAGFYAWSRDDIDVTKNFIESYKDLDWFWFNWALHYSSNWRDHLPNGLPPYVGNNQVTRVYTTELDAFAAPIKKLFESVKDATWQYTVPLVSFTDYQGNRMRTNPSCLYDLRAVWSNTDGAFSGNVRLPDDPNAIQAPDISDEQKDRQEFFYDIVSGRKVVLSFYGTEPRHISVSNFLYPTETFIAEIDVDK